MTETAPSIRPARAATDWTDAGALTSLAALLLMFGIVMVALGVSDYDRTEGAIGVVIGVASLLGWMTLVAAGGIVLARGRQRALGVIPILATLGWCAVAAGLMMSGSTSAILIATPLPPVISISVMTAGTIAAAVILLLTSIVLRLVRRRDSSAPVTRHGQR